MISHTAHKFHVNKTKTILLFGVLQTRHFIFNSFTGVFILNANPHVTKVNPPFWLLPVWSHDNFTDQRTPDYFLGVDRDWIECKDRQLWVDIVNIVVSKYRVFWLDDFVNKSSKIIHSCFMTVKGWLSVMIFYTWESTNQNTVLNTNSTHRHPTSKQQKIRLRS